MNPVRHVRASLRFGAVMLATGAIAPPTLLIMLVTGGGGLGARLRIQAWWSRALIWIMGIRVQREGVIENFSGVVVSNHVSYLDIPVLAALHPVRFVAKSEIASWPLIGILARLSSTVYLDRSRGRDLLRVSKELSQTRELGQSVLIFPEGKSTSGAEVGRFYPALLQWAAKAEVDCLGVALSYATPGTPGAPAWNACWWGEIGLLRHYWRLLGMPVIEAKVSIAPKPRRSTNRRELARDLWNDVSLAFEPIDQDPPPPNCPWPDVRPRGADGQVLLSARGAETESS